MKLVIFGLAITSSWGNGHATLWRGLCRALAQRGHRVVFFERDVPYYASHRDLVEPDFVTVVLYSAWGEVADVARRHLDDADVGMVTSYCPDGLAATDLVISSRVPLRTFYDLDTPVTLTRLWQGETLCYVGQRGFRDFDLVLSCTGGSAVTALRERFGARRVVPLYGSVDPTLYYPVAAQERFRADLSYLGTYAADRQASLETLFVEPARRRPEKRFVMGGAQYPQFFPWTPNIYFLHHVTPGQHPAFFSSSRLTLNVTRQAMARLGFCPSGRLFEATACGAAVLSDTWQGLDQFFVPGEEILIGATPEDSLAALDLSEAELTRIARAGRERTLAEHTAEVRAGELEALFADGKVPAEALAVHA